MSLTTYVSYVQRIKDLCMFWQEISSPRQPLLQKVAHTYSPHLITYVHVDTP